MLKKNNTRLDAFEEGLLDKNDLESLKEKCESKNNTILANPIPTQINDTTPPTQIPRSINEHVERANSIIIFNLQEQRSKIDQKFFYEKPK